MIASNEQNLFLQQKLCYEMCGSGKTFCNNLIVKDPKNNIKSFVVYFKKSAELQEIIYNYFHFERFFI